MKTACFIPIKANSERVPGKNLRILNGKKLYQYICEHVKQADVFDDVPFAVETELFEFLSSKDVVDIPFCVVVLSVKFKSIP